MVGDIMKKHFPFMIVGAIIGLVFLTCIILLLAGKVSFANNGFAVDKYDQLYVGKQRKIVVLKDNICVKTIKPPTSRAYKFTIIDGETILLSTSTKIYKMDLSGKILSESADDGNKLYSQLQWKKTYTDHKGFNYTLKSNWGRRSIYKEGDQIYVMPLLDYIFLVLLVFSATILIVTCLAVVVKRFKTII